ncbi:MAG: hypothetical protein F6K65_38470 [Moorea sp. SIO3C2]|nr:hypothetical protein [Moorena sp. SIO3C2]
MNLLAILAMPSKKFWIQTSGAENLEVNRFTVAVDLRRFCFHVTTMPPVLKDWLENLGCLLPLGFFGFCIAFVLHWVNTETGPARMLIIWQARLWNGQYFSTVTTVALFVPIVLGTWLISAMLRCGLKKFGIYSDTRQP